MMKLNIKDLVVEIDKKIILDKLNLNIKPGEIHAIMGPNGVGKSTLSRVLMGDQNYHVVDGDILFNDESSSSFSIVILAVPFSGVSIVAPTIQQDLYGHIKG